MRSAERWSRRLLALVACVAGAGCNVVPLGGPPVTGTPEAAVAKLPASASASAPSGPSAAERAAAAEARIDPAAQQRFDDARRALAAGRADEAERGFRALTRSDPGLGGPHANLGLIHRQNGKLAEAVAAFEQAVRASPEQPIFHNQLGIAYRQQGQFAKAREAYERAMALDAAYAAPQLNLGILHDLYLGDGARALELYERYQILTAGKDAQVGKWVADLKNRKPGQRLVSKKEQP